MSASRRKPTQPPRSMMVTIDGSNWFAMRTVSRRMRQFVSSVARNPEKKDRGMASSRMTGRATILSTASSAPIMMNPAASPVIAMYCGTYKLRAIRRPIVRTNRQVILRGSDIEEEKGHVQTSW